MSNLVEEAFKNLSVKGIGKTYVSVDPEYIEVNAQDLADLINENKRLSKKVAKFKRKYKEACLELADIDNKSRDYAWCGDFVTKLIGSVNITEPSTPEEFAQKLKSATKEVINAKKGK
jgi:hypothetical protein